MYRGDSYSLMADYNAWMNCKLDEAAAGLPDAERKRDLGAFFKSLHGTLNHILFADLIFLARFTGSTMPEGDFGGELHDDFETLRAERETTDARILDWVAGLDRAWLGETLTFTSMIDGVTRSALRARSPSSGRHRSAPRSKRSFWTRPSMASSAPSVCSRARPMVALASSTVP